MKEYLIRPVDADFFAIPPDEWRDVLRPTSLASQIIEGGGNLRLKVLGAEIAFYDEMDGIHVCFEKGEISEVAANQIVEEIRQRLVEATKEEARAVPL